MNILITRPLIDAEDLMGRLFSLGHKIIHIPTLKVKPIINQECDAKNYDAFIFTSANAIRNLNLLNEDKKKLCFCVGSITEKIVRQKGYSKTISAGGNVNALKNIILNSDFYILYLEEFPCRIFPGNYIFCLFFYVCSFFVVFGRFWPD